MTGPASDEPDPHTLADDTDELGWEIDQHGRMLEYTAADDSETTEPYQLEA